MITLYDYTTGERTVIAAERVNDEAARRLLPQDAATQARYYRARLAGYKPIAAMCYAIHPQQTERARAIGASAPVNDSEE